VSEYLLRANGLTVLILPDHSTPTATFMVTYRVGSRNEGPGVTGATHFLEHLMFKDTKKFRAARGNRLDQFLESVGARYNATTWLDRTNYYATVSRSDLAAAMKVEAGRLRGLLLRDRDRRTEATVIRDELERGQSHPATRLWQEIYAAAFAVHPYHHPTIGWPGDVATVSTERLRQFYDDFYWPDNATASVIGDIEAPEALALVEKYYGRFPRAPRPIPAMTAMEPRQTGARRVTVRLAGEQGLIALAHKSPPATHADYAPLVILGDLLTDGKNSRLQQALIDRGLATRVQADTGFHRDPSLHHLTVTLAPGAGHAEAEAVLLAEIEKIQLYEATDLEVRTAIAKETARESYARDGSASIASRLNECIAAGDWTLYSTLPAALRAVTPADVQRVALDYLIPDRSTTGWFVPTSPP
jgi:zinc protease